MASRGGWVRGNDEVQIALAETELGLGWPRSVHRLEVRSEWPKPSNRFISRQMQTKGTVVSAGLQLMQISRLTGCNKAERRQQTCSGDEQWSSALSWGIPHA